jgi:hypothetical protein
LVLKDFAGQDRDSDRARQPSHPSALGAKGPTAASVAQKPNKMQVAEVDREIGFREAGEIHG